MTRNDLPKLFQEQNQLGIGAEIGVYRGDFAKIILNDWKGKLLLVDAYKPYKTALELDTAFEYAKNQLKGENIEWININSPESAKKVKDGSLDWVYIDANHSYESAKIDIPTWINKVRKGGIISGHDYETWDDRDEEFGVQKALDEFLVGKDYTLCLTDDSPRSWLLQI